MEYVKEIISGFGIEIGLPDLALDAGNCCTLQFDQVIVNVEYLPESEEFYFYARIGAIPANNEGRLRVFRQLLESNCFYRRTSGGVIGIDSARDAIIYTNKTGIPGLDARKFSEYMEAFVDITEGFYRDLLDESAISGTLQTPPITGIRV